jgi:hypothetical protein
MESFRGHVKLEKSSETGNRDMSFSGTTQSSWEHEIGQRIEEVGEERNIPCSED